MPRPSRWAGGLLVATLLLSLAPAIGAAAEVEPAPEPVTFVWPTEGRMTQKYGCTGLRFEPRRGNCRHFHSGIDIANAAGTPIVAMADGVVKLVGWNPYDRPGRRAWIVVIDHGDGLQSWYAHMLPRRPDGIKRGATVSAGQMIGYMGSTGHSTGVHLHFSLLRRGQPVDPRDYLGPRGGNAGKAAGTLALPEPEQSGIARLPSWLWFAVPGFPEPKRGRSGVASRL